MEELFGFVNDYDAVNLDALFDSLSEVTADTDLILTPHAVRAVCRNEFAYKVLLVLGKAAEENPHLHLLFRDEEE
jgi:RNAse (barnase) inhibitor barstar